MKRLVVVLVALGLPNSAAHPHCPRSLPAHMSTNPAMTVQRHPAHGSRSRQRENP